MKEMESLADLAPEEVPESSRFLLEIDFIELSRYHIETHKYWTLAVNAALVPQNRKQARGARAKRMQCQINAKIPSRQKLGMVTIEQQIWKDGMHQSPMQNSSNVATSHTQTSMESFTQKQPHPSAALSLLKLNKRMRKPDWPSHLWAHCVRGYTFSLFLAFRPDLSSNNLRPKGLGTHWGTQPSRPVWPCCGKTRQSKRLPSVTILHSIVVVIY